MAHILTNIGEEYYTETALNGVTLTVGLYNDTTDAIADTDDLAAITTEPGNTNYARASDTFSVADLETSSNWGIQNDTQLTFDFSDTSTTETLTSYFVVANFISDEAADGTTAADHLIATGSLSQDRDAGSIDTLNIEAGGVAVSIN